MTSTPSHDNKIFVDIYESGLQTIKENLPYLTENVFCDYLYYMDMIGICDLG